MTGLDFHDPLLLDKLLSEEERAIQGAVRQFVQDRVMPGIGTQSLRSSARSINTACMYRRGNLGPKLLSGSTSVIVPM